ncbi:hypothetical protein HDIA_3451 [Hartmannibacter diazotrophicus]|uniref:Uncharacterized protein n=2 Tax=Hartmannibacter diazotrophicus TaxID=1482074 RepID=A0A2C9D9K7_9HYPH|nr:hypothetical protein HDIA_3451 [Hartmannibacter diazotrophicus]
MKAAQSSPVHMAVAFAAMGGWAIWVNSAHPMPRPIIVGLVQGCLSALITLFLKRMIEAMARQLSGSAALLLPPLAAMLCSLVLLVTIHRLAGTPEIALTIALPLSVTTVYAALYNFALWRHGHG